MMCVCVCLYTSSEANDIMVCVCLYTSREANDIMVCVCVYIQAVKLMI